MRITDSNYLLFSCSNKSTVLINEWPNWKKDAYNKMFAISAHAEKIVVER